MNSEAPQKLPSSGFSRTNLAISDIECTAASVGTKTWFLSAGVGWPQLGTAEYPWYADTRVFWPEKFGDWGAVLPQFASELAAYAAS